MQYGLIGEKLGHSFSPEIHSNLASYEYELVELDRDKVAEFLHSRNFLGVNVTIPYKEVVMPYLDEIDEKAKRVGSVNTVINRDGKLLGYNTDYYGFSYMLQSVGITLKDKVVAILGSGGASKTAIAVAKDGGAKEILIVSRSGEVNYENIKERKDINVIINASPVGMFPKTGECLVDLGWFENLQGVADMVYNPSVTELLFRAKSNNIKCVNGLIMLVAQAKRASELFLGKTLDDSVIMPIVKKVETETKNIVLVGMPGSGKSTIGKRVAKLLEREFLDTDKEFEKEYGISPKECIEKEGENAFREKEKQIVKKVCSLSKRVIATGGGAVKNKDNRKAIKSNSFTCYLERDLAKLPTKNRPLSTPNGLEKLFLERDPLYREVADFSVQNDGAVVEIAEKIIANIFGKIE